MDDENFMKKTTDPERMKAVIDLRHFIETVLRDGQPKVGKMFRKLSLDPIAMSDLIRTATVSAACTVPPICLDIISDVLKMGVTIGYRYAMTIQMEEQFNRIASNDGQGPNGQSIEDDDDDSNS